MRLRIFLFLAVEHCTGCRDAVMFYFFTIAIFQAAHWHVVIDTFMPKPSDRGINIIKGGDGNIFNITNTLAVHWQIS